MKPYGFPIHAAVDGYSRRVLWLDVCISNNLPTLPVRLYLSRVRENGGCPLLTRSDFRTQNGLLAAMQCYFRSDDEPFCGESGHSYGSSTRNQRIENWWSHLRKSCTGWWISFFKDLVDEGVVDLGTELQKECLWFCFSTILQESLDKMKEYWNTHNIRPSRHETIAGVPDILFYLPEQSGGTDCLIPVDRAKIDEMELQCQQEDDENIFQEYFKYVMEQEHFQYPLNHDEATILFSHLIRIAQA